MRDIKFRVWRPVVNRFRHFDISTGFNVENADVFEVVEQYTGLKDKNGVEIYDGDVFFDGIENCIIEWHESTASFLANDGAEKHGISSFCEYEIIGNIHENPELLEGK